MICIGTVTKIMTNILALDASTELCSVALLCEGHLLEKMSDTPRSHANRLLPMVDEVLAEAGISLNQIDAIAFGAGPGSFTGLRICVGVVQGLAFGASLPVIAISSLESMAFAAQQRYAPLRYVVPAIDARMGELYWAVYDVSGPAPQIVSVPRVASAVAVDASLLDSPTTKNATGVGSGWGLLHRSRHILSRCEEDFWPAAAAVANLGSESFRAGVYMNATSAEPTYLRTEISWKKRERIRRDY